MPEWNNQQEDALDRVSRWMRDPNREPVFRLFGYAGTGKTTLARHLAATSGGIVLFAAYTGKAALVMQRAGCAGARTIHSLIYTPFDPDDAFHVVESLKVQIASESDPDQREHLIKELRKLEESLKSTERPKPTFILNEESDLKNAALLVVDEASMVDVDMARDLMSFKVPILVLGDPAQLPPVGGHGYFTAEEPDVMLTKIMRQARDNPIIDLATRVREDGRVPLGSFGTSAVINGFPDPAEALDFSQIIVGKNVTRRNVNAWIRKQLGYSLLTPQRNDRLICLRNDKEEGLLNGGMWVCEKDAYQDVHDDRFTDLFDIRSEDTNELKAHILAHRHIFTGEERKMFKWEWREAQEFDFAYAITAHKAQGSQWPRVCVSDESHIFGEDGRRWLYTAITRAQDSVRVYRR